jgi:hypothetical protein
VKSGIISILKKDRRSNADVEYLVPAVKNGEKG